MLFKVQYTAHNLVLSVVDIRVKSNIRKGKKNYKRFVGGKDSVTGNVDN